MFFEKAKPIWLKDLSCEMNIQAGFKTEIFAEKGKKYSINIADSCLYRLFVNGEFVCYGPARAGHGYARVDEIDITEKMTEGKNTIAIEAAGYNCLSFYLIKRTSFVTAEVFCNGKAVASTGYDFAGVRLSQKVQKINRFSFQRPFGDVWELDINSDMYFWTTRDVPTMETEVIQEEIKYLSRRAKMPEFNISPCDSYLEKGTLEVAPELDDYIKKRANFWDDVYTDFSTFPQKDIVNSPIKDYCLRKPVKEKDLSGKGQVVISEGEYIILDMSRNYTGFVKTLFTANKDSRVLIGMDEVLTDGMPDPMRKFQTGQIIGYNVTASDKDYDFESFECYGFRYAMIMVVKGEITFKDFSLREYIYPLHNTPEIHTDDVELKKIYEATIETYRQNVVDIYMDCPTRERAGWLCDSYYTAQMEWFLTGKGDVEHDFIENFMLFSPRDDIPEGMMPKCYPADHGKHNTYIPQWAMWLAFEVDQYLQREKTADKAEYKDFFYKLIRFFEAYENADGLVEKLPSWNFIEWSKANQWTQDVSYPTNMMYSNLLKITGKIYNDKALVEKGEALAEKVIEKSFDGELFVDNAVYNEDGVLVNTGNRSETCQYYAYAFDVIKDIDDPRFSYLKNAVFNIFGSKREETGELPDVEYANAMMGIYIRMELLFKWGKYEKLLDEIKEYFGKMADLTGTLWEHNKVAQSLNHGFASYIGYLIYECLKRL